jgi:tetratricopeptide (TPR) repeat protein
MLVTALGSPDPVLRDGAMASLVSVPDATALIVKAIPKANAAQRLALVRALGLRRDRDATGDLVLLLQNQDGPTTSAALEALGEVGGSAAVEVLLNAAQNGPAQHRPLALRAYLASLESLKDPARIQAGYEQALRVAPSDEERRLALRGLAGLGRPSSQAAVEPYLNTPLRGEAAAVLAAIGDRFLAVGQKEQAVPLYQRALGAATDAGLRRRIGTRLRAAGVEIDLAAEGGFVTRWKALGPLPGQERWTKEDAFNPTVPVDASKPVMVDGQPLSWKPVTVSDPDGMLDLEQAVAQRGDAVAYLLAEVVSPQEQEVLLKIGSDDGFVVWVNGEKEGELLAARPYTVDQNTVKARLKAGVNTVLVKITQGGGQWAAGVRITTSAGVPLRLEQRR